LAYIGGDNVEFNVNDIFVINERGASYNKSVIQISSVEDNPSGGKNCRFVTIDGRPPSNNYFQPGSMFASFLVPYNPRALGYKRASDVLNAYLREGRVRPGDVHHFEKAIKTLDAMHRRLVAEVVET
jgi:hypothetical protein